MERQILKRPHPVGICERSAELPEYFVADIDDEFKVGAAAFFIEEEDEFSSQADPVEEHQGRADEAHVLLLLTFYCFFRAGDEETEHISDAKQ